jgi:hypothetical protein
LKELDEICRDLSKQIHREPRIILNQIEDESKRLEIKEVFQGYFPGVEWEEIEAKRSFDDVNASGRFHEYLHSHIPRLLFYLLTFFKRRDLIISPIAVPYLYNVAASKKTVFIDQSLRGCVRENRIFKAFLDLFVTIFKGLKRVYLDFPRALKNSGLKDITPCRPEVI